MWGWHVIYLNHLNIPMSHDVNIYLYIYIFSFIVYVFIYIIYIYHFHQILFHPILFCSKVSQPNKRESYLGSTRKLSQDPGYAFAYNNLAVLNPQVGPRKGGLGGGWQPCFCG